MGRVTKDPEERKAELIQAAEALFIEKGYERTAVSDIVKKCKVAQGTFYYYFDSKEDILDAILDQYANVMVEELTEIMKRRDIDAVGKLVAFSRLSLSLGRGKGRLIDYVHDEEHAHIHLKLEKRFYRETLDLWIELMEEGHEEGLFDVPYPRETALALLATSNVLHHEAYTPGIHFDLEQMQATVQIMERILGARPGTFEEVLQLLGM